MEFAANSSVRPSVNGWVEKRTADAVASVSLGFDTARLRCDAGLAPDRLFVRGKMLRSSEVRSWKIALRMRSNAHNTRAGFTPLETVETETEYLAHLEPAPDVILADYSLPQFDAQRALELLQSRGLDIPFLIVSGNIGEEIAVSAMRRGADDYVLKDRLARLGQAVSNALAQRRQRHEKQLAEAAMRERDDRFRAPFQQAAVGRHSSGLTGDGSWSTSTLRLARLQPNGTVYALLQGEHSPG